MNSGARSQRSGSAKNSISAHQKAWQHQAWLAAKPLVLVNVGEGGK